MFLGSERSWGQYYLKKHSVTFYLIMMEYESLFNSRDELVSERLFGFCGLLWASVDFELFYLVPVHLC